MKTANKIYISIVLLFVFAFCWYLSSNATANQNIERNTQRQQIINSIFSVDKINSNDKDLIIALDESDSIVDMVITTNNGAAKGGGVGALILSASSNLYYHSIEVLIGKEDLKYITAGASEGDIFQWGLDYPLGSVRFINRKDIAELGNGDFSFKLTRKNNDILNESAKKIIGNRPIMQLDLKINNQNIKLVNGLIQIEIPYQPPAGEDPNKLILYQVDKSGQITPIRNSQCLSITKTAVDKYYVQGMIKGPGIYAIGYNDISYHDAAGWQKPYVSFVAARSIMDDNAGLFKPNNNITRGDLAYYLANLSEQNLEFFTNSVLSDIPTDHPHAQAIVWAYSTGVIKGYEDGTFRPNQIITRQELAAMLYRYTQIIAKTHMPRTNKAIIFKDDKAIGGFAKEAVSCLQQAGVINGKDNEYFAPLTNVTRDECAKMIATLVSGIMDGKTKFIPIN